ncbi:flagellar hook-length control protein FliK [Sedimentibacter sp. zth1]|uniref:flagellar hook-length control protein FliK n=1 Tax=Sedimentibacter sp. zth1 TaxID=2816908 RepID=UPI001A911155|nr:flagellar hook-length control protein FliK [Sedimentibacter sp. zth1]QSX07198.1 flagellar hook-length control protein FliK [Sedimentibacter sp. zth1]
MGTNILNDINIRKKPIVSSKPNEVSKPNETSKKTDNSIVDNDSFSKLLNRTVVNDKQPKEVVKSTTNEIDEQFINEEDKTSNNLMSYILLLLQNVNLNATNSLDSNIADDNTNNTLLTQLNIVDNNTNNTLLNQLNCDLIIPNSSVSNVIYANNNSNNASVLVEQLLSQGLVNNEQSSPADALLNLFSDLSTDTNLLDIVDSAIHPYIASNNIESLSKLITQYDGDSKNVVLENIINLISQKLDSKILVSASNENSLVNTNTAENLNTLDFNIVNQNIKNMLSEDKSIEELVLTTKPINRQNEEQQINKNEDKTNTVENDVNLSDLELPKINNMFKVTDEASMIKENTINQVKEQIVIMKDKGIDTVSMQLTPENLGKLDIKMIFDKGILTVEIVASNAKTQSLLLSNLDELKAVLQDSSQEKTFINVNTQKELADEYQNQNNQNNRQSQQQERKDNREYVETETSNMSDFENVDFLSELTKLREIYYNY